MSETESVLDAASDEERSWRRFVPHVVVLVVVAVLGLLLYRLMSSDSMARKSVSQVVQVKMLPPPPPPPPPKEEVQPEEKIEPTPEPDEPVPLDEPPPLAAPSDPGPPGPPGPPGGVAGLPGGGAPGGIAGGGGGRGGGGGTPFGSYAAMLQSRVLAAVQREAALRRTRYRVNVQVWLTPEGVPQKVELMSSLGSAELDRRFKKTLMSMSALPQAPPPEMPQPIVLQVNSM